MSKGFIVYKRLKIGKLSSDIILETTIKPTMGSREKRIFGENNKKGKALHNQIVCRKTTEHC